VNHLPELVGGLGVITLIGHGKLGAEEEITDRVLMKDPMDHDAVGMALEVDTVILASETMKRAAIPLDLAEVLSG
jgi:hypothetical protein